VLASGQDAIAKHFASRTRPVGTVQFDQVPHQLSAFGPMLDDAGDRLGCEVHGQHKCGDHTIVIGAIRAVEVRRDPQPLLQYAGTYR
jgi:flavin reductase (DIM6/NTAB) family NADH-FMN oxidoreductase RutF